jgi:protein tyrosine phosphatase
VHCSAGIGRTGTYIALLLLIESIEYQRQLGAIAQVSIFGTVRRLREQRWLMVKKEKQYRFLYSYIQNWLKNGILPNQK